MATVGCSISALRNQARSEPTVAVKDERGLIVTNELNASFG